MYIYVELWKFRQKWLDLSAEDRNAWMSELGVTIQQLLGEGVEAVGFAINDEDTPHTSGFDYLAIWKMPDKEMVKKFERAVEESGLHDYYEQVNTRGEQLDLNEVVADLLNC
ncbi:MAG: hypothetical protein DWQ47_15950 [Acidobacteria bacterium]|nr:MAG: hypothetical protein DWQ32_03350 [Acidobacteriota bacterium]REK02450.1 MAG: hypothetical protein DWQ38_08785 [Acidobacteriota bacterium]REK13748.1 MAG: hypothetical protein DWQ43_09040 [Acidobacteriota bacterium]REK41742.1 MAG: hypothetical protein DWQ47_15950 [Acidobacteriota bacterium]